MERLNFEAEAIGFHLTAHPLDTYAKALRRLGTTPCAQVETVAQSGVTRIRLAGMVVAQKERVTRTGNRMAWVRITDASGSCEVTLFAEVLSRSRELLANGSNVLVTADLRQDGEALRVTAQDVVVTRSGRCRCGAAMRIWLRETASVPHIRDLLGREGRGKGRVILVPRAWHHAKRRDRAARRLQCHATAGAGVEGDPRRRAGGGVIAWSATASWLAQKGVSTCRGTRMNAPRSLVQALPMRGVLASAGLRRGTALSLSYRLERPMAA